MRPSQPPDSADHAAIAPLDVTAMATTTYDILRMRGVPLGKRDFLGAMKVDDENWHVLTVSRRDPKTGEYTMEKAPCYHLIEDKPDADAA